MLDEMIHFLNDLNREFATGAVDYRWNGYHDNCVHALRNALAAASIGDPISVRASKLRQLFHLAIPANAGDQPRRHRATPGAIDSATPAISRRRSAQRAAGVRAATLTRHGGVLVSLPVHPLNDIFDPRPRPLMVFQRPGDEAHDRTPPPVLDDRASPISSRTSPTSRRSAATSSPGARTSVASSPPCGATATGASAAATSPT
jgi:hypothetical protein